MVLFISLVLLLARAMISWRSQRIDALTADVARAEKVLHETGGKSLSQKEELCQPSRGTLEYGKAGRGENKHSKTDKFKNLKNVIRCF